MRDGREFLLAAPESMLIGAEVVTPPQRGCNYIYLFMSPEFDTAFLRVIDSFVFLVDRRPGVLDKKRMVDQNWVGVLVVGAVATLTGKESLRVQCGWFHSVTWRWLLISNITQMEVKSDNRFRNG